MLWWKAVSSTGYVRYCEACERHAHAKNRWRIVKRREWADGLELGQHVLGDDNGRGEALATMRDAVPDCSETI